jgi:hypothetical protein
VCDTSREKLEGDLSRAHADGFQRSSSPYVPSHSICLSISARAETMLGVSAGSVSLFVCRSKTDLGLRVYEVSDGDLGNLLAGKCMALDVWVGGLCPTTSWSWLMMWKPFVIGNVLLTCAVSGV